jgi:hypothetical protein
LRVEGLEWRDSVVVQNIEIHDTLREVTTITVDRNDKGDTLRLIQVTERNRYRDRDRVRDEHQKTVVKTDTVYIERKDSVVVKEANVSHQTSSISHLLKWIFAVICAIIVLIVVVKVGLRRSLF